MDSEFRYKFTRISVLHDVNFIENILTSYSDKINIQMYIINKAWHFIIGYQRNTFKPKTQFELLLWMGTVLEI